MDKKTINSLIGKFVIFLLFVCLELLTGFMEMVVNAKEESTKVIGKVYEFEEKDSYEFSKKNTYTTTDNNCQTYGLFSIDGNIKSKEIKEGIPSYEINGGNVLLTYTYNDNLLNAKEEDWHLVDDKSKLVDDIKLNDNIMSGALVLQTSKDGQTWINNVIKTNIFRSTPVGEGVFYTTNDIQLLNGCYYRLIIVYEISIKVGQNQVLFLKTDEFEYKKYAEVYEFYLYDKSMKNLKENSNSPSKNLGSKVKTGKDNGYSGEEEIDDKDAHFGWTLGQFYVSGFTSTAKDDTEMPVFLKNVNDKVILHFKLQQDINKLNGKNSLSIAEDTNSYDQYFETDKMNMGYGTLIIRHTDFEGTKHEPIIYTNYLEANATNGANTVVQMFEEGDYEVALDYKIKDVPYEVLGQAIVPKYTNYRIAFRFSVRNGNCMAYPMDVVTGTELMDKSITSNGFILDMAKSRYLKINVKKSVLIKNDNGYSEDVRFNESAKEGDKYIDEGIYTFIVKNQYTNEQTTKTIYVGTDDILKALSVTGLSIEEINNQLKQGAYIMADGTIKMPEPIAKEETIISTETEIMNESIVNLEDNIEQISENEEIVQTDSEQNEMKEQNDELIPYNKIIWIVAVGIMAVLVVSVFVYYGKKRKNNLENRY